jgi:putative membrane protein
MWRKQAGLGLALGALLLAGCGALGWDQRETQTVATPGGQVPAGGYASTMLPGNVGARDKDALFVAEAAHDSASEIEMSRVAEQRATSQATKDYARMIVEDHAAANRQLMELAQRENLPLPGTPSAGVAQKTDEMQTAKADGFDLDYMTRMVEDHNRALNMYRDVANSSQDPNLRAWAASQIPILEKHQRQGMVLADTLNKSAKKTAAQ